MVSYHPQTSPTSEQAKPTSRTLDLTAIARYIFGVEPDVLFACTGSSGEVEEGSSFPSPLRLPPVMALPPDKRGMEVASAPAPPSPATPAAEVKPILGFPEKFELALRYGESRMAQDVDLGDSDRRASTAELGRRTRGRYRREGAGQGQGTDQAKG